MGKPVLQNALWALVAVSATAFVALVDYAFFNIVLGRPDLAATELRTSRSHVRHAVPKPVEGISADEIRAHVAQADLDDSLPAPSPADGSVTQQSVVQGCLRRVAVEIAQPHSELRCYLGSVIRVTRVNGVASYQTEVCGGTPVTCPGGSSSLKP